MWELQWVVFIKASSWLYFWMTLFNVAWKRDNIDNIYLYNNWHTVKPVLSGHSKTDKRKILMATGCLMKVKGIAECSPWPAESDSWSWKPTFCLLIEWLLKTGFNVFALILCMLGNFACFFIVSGLLSQSKFSKKNHVKNIISVKQFRPRSG